MTSNTHPDSESSSDSLLPSRSGRKTVAILAVVVGVIAAVVLAFTLSSDDDPSSSKGGPSGSGHLGDLGEIGEVGKEEKLRKAVESARKSTESNELAAADRAAITKCVDSLQSSMAPERSKELVLDITAFGSHQNQPAILLGYTSADSSNKKLQVFILKRPDCSILGAQSF